MAKDILTDQLFLNGDFNVGYSDEQHIQDVILAAPGHYKQHPLIGVDVLQYVNAPMSPRVIAEMERNIQLQLQADGAKNIKVIVHPKTKTIDATGAYL